MICRLYATGVSSRPISGLARSDIVVSTSSDHVFVAFLLQFREHQLGIKFVVNDVCSFDGVRLLAPEMFRNMLLAGFFRGVSSSGHRSDNLLLP